MTVRDVRPRCVPLVVPIVMPGTTIFMLIAGSAILTIPAVFSRFAMFTNGAVLIHALPRFVASLTAPLVISPRRHSHEH